MQEMTAAAATNEKNNLALALEYAARGWYVFPCIEQPGKHFKTPYKHEDDLPHGKNNATTEPDTIRRWWIRWPNALIGLYCEKSGFFVVDIDRKNGNDGWMDLVELIEKYGGGQPLEVGPIQTTPSGGLHLFFKWPVGVNIPNNAGKLAPGLDLRSNGYVCTGVNFYQWMPDHGPSVKLTDAAAWLLALIAALKTAKGKGEAGAQSAATTTQPLKDAGAYWLNYYTGRASIGTRNQCGFYLACQLRDSGLSIGEAESVMIRYAAAVPQNSHDQYTERAALASLDQAYKGPRREAALPGIAGVLNHRAEQLQQAAPAAPSSPTETEAPRAPEYYPLEKVRAAYDNGEAGDAGLFSDLHTGRLAYDHAEGVWYQWNGNHWQPDTTREVYRLVSTRLVPQFLHAAAEAQTGGNEPLAKELTKRAAALCNRKRADNVLFLAAGLPGLALTGEEWDRNPWLLGVKNGVIDLQAGLFRPGRPGDYIRAIAPVEWRGSDTPAPRWERFLSEVFAGDSELVGYVQRLLGYGITGLTTEHILPILWGEGRNGKGTLLETLGDVLGQNLAISSQADALMDIQKGGGPQPFVYALRGKRFVWASESNEGRRINAGLVKQLTGGDRLHVRTLHSKPVEFHPTHLIMLMTNHKPHIPADDTAIWDRVCLIPFTVRFVDQPKAANEQPRDRDLKNKLLEEAAGILAWLVRGCREWQGHGLASAPKAVKAATEEYREEEDTLGLFIAECCTLEATATVKAGQLYAAYREWSKANGIPEMSLSAFGKRMAKRFTKRESHGVYYDGIGLMAND